MPATQPTVRQFMTPDPTTIDGGLSVSDARTRMFQINARHLPVYVGGHLVGILSEGDLARISAVEGFESHTSTAEQACTPNPYVVAPNTPLVEVAQVLADQKFGAALVMEGGHLLGMFTVIDALRALVSVLGQGSASVGLDASGDASTASSASPGDTLTGHSPDPRHDALLHHRGTVDALSQSSQGIRVGIDTNNPSVDVHSDVGRRSEMRRAARTVYGRDDEPSDEGNGGGKAS